MHEVAEELAVERIIAHILDDGAPIGVRMGLAQLLFGSLGKPHEQQRLDSVRPVTIDDLLVTENGIGGGRQRRDLKHRQQK